MSLAPIPTDQLLGPLNAVERRNAPPALWARGDRTLLAAGPRVAVVGARAATANGLARARRLVRFLVERGVVVVSGLAAGIDTAAHTTAIRDGGRTIAVIGTGIDVAFPAANKALQERIGRDHLLLSQFLPAAGVQKTRFPQRNRTMALIADATVIVEASDSSGTLSQGWEALRLGRPLFLLRSVVSDKSLTWPAEMLGFGAVILDAPEDLLPALPAGHHDRQAVAF